MASAGDVIDNGQGFRLELVRTAADTAGELLEMKASYSGGDLPPSHTHPKQDEHFTVLDGSVRAVIGGTDRLYDAGESFDVPAGTPHQMAATGPATVRWEVRPALRTEDFFTKIYGARQAGGVKALLRTCAVLAEFRDEFRPVKPVEPLQGLLVHALAPLGRRISPEDQ
jgi:quercetin dioxygenase-like cupin family protein